MSELSTIASPRSTVSPGRTVTFVVAVSNNGIIGHEGAMPWHLPEDLKHFKRITLGHAMVMGRRTFESIGRPLPGRRSLVVTRQQDWSAPGVEVFHSIEAALDAAGPAVMVVGGGDLYRQLLPLADVLEVTHIDADLEGDTSFPAIDPAIWERVGGETHDGFSFVTYHRRESSAPGEHDLALMLATLEPLLAPEPYVYCTVNWAWSDPQLIAAEPLATIREVEGLTLILTRARAVELGLEFQFPAALISLTVHSALDAVGLTAAFAEALKAVGISCNVLAGFHHDHILVPYEQRAAAMTALAGLRG